MRNHSESQFCKVLFYRLFAGVAKRYDEATGRNDATHIKRRNQYDSIEREDLSPTLAELIAVEWEEGLERIVGRRNRKQVERRTYVSFT